MEDSSFWFRHRNACITEMVKNFPPPANGTVFDIGGGNGFVTLGLLKAGFEAVLVEPGPAGASNGKARGIENVVCATIADAGFKAESMHAVGLFDVIEHIEDDDAFLRTLKPLVKPGGRLYATVPVFSALWSTEDIHAGHFRRYTRSSICSVIENAGFKIDYATYFFRPLPLPIFLLRSVPYRLGLDRRKDHKTADDHQVSVGASVMDALLDRELENIRRARPMMFGASCLLCATVR